MYIPIFVVILITILVFFDMVLSFLLWAREDSTERNPLKVLSNMFKARENKGGNKK